MCGRYALHAHPDVVALQFGLDAAPSFKPRYNICPGTDVLVVGADSSGRRAAVERRWGLIPYWAKDASVGRKLANACGETLDAQLFALAGLTAVWHGPQGVVRSVALITAAPNPLASADRMAAHPVGMRVNMPAADDASLLEPTDEGARQADLL